MRKKLRITLTTLLIAALGMFTWWALTPREPSYQGKPLTFWLKQYADNSLWASFPVLGPYNDSGQQAEIAIRQIGTNAIPTLLQMLQANDRPWKLKLFDLLDRQSLINISRSTATERNRYAASGFNVLGGNAKESVPALIEIYQRNLSIDSATWTACSLGAIGLPARSATPALIKGMTNPPLVQSYSLDALERIHAEPALVVPPLIKYLSERQQGIGGKVADVLGSFGADAKPAVPALIELLQADNYESRFHATNALKQIDPEAAAQAGVK